MFYNFRKNKKAFTLVELIVVIAIIAILGAVVGVTVSTFVNKARKTAATEPLSGLAGNWESYLVDSPNKKLKDVIAELFEDDKTSFYVSNNAMWNTGISSLTGTQYIYFHNDDADKYWGELKIVDGKAKKSDVKALDAAPSAKNGFPTA